jgi:bifunctional non-homologous end joining protein LigD
MHLFLPVAPGLTYDVVRLFAIAIAERLVAARPDLVTTKVPKEQRGQRVYIDSNQNGRGRSISCVYSVRPRRGAPVATPLDWSEVTARLLPSQFTIADAGRRLAERGDLFAPVLTDLQDLAPAIGQLSTRSRGGE